MGSRQKIFHGFLKARNLTTSIKHCKTLKPCYSLNSYIFQRDFSSIKLSDVELTSERYKGQVSRGDYGHLSNEDITFFRDLLGEQRVLTEASDIEGHNVDWLKMVRGTGIKIK
jgi:hypothetical protein